MLGEEDFRHVCHFCCLFLLYQPVDEDKQAQPDHVHEVPVPGNPLKAKVILRLEVAGQHAEKDDQQHDGAERHVEAMKTGQHEKGGAIGSTRQLKVEIGIGVAIFVRLQTNKEKSQGESQEQAQLELPALIELECPVCPGNCHSRGQQYQCVERWKAPGAHWRKFIFNARTGSRPSSRKVGPQQLMLEVAKFRDGEYSHVIERAEESSKKHDLGEDEPAHTPAERGIHLLVEFATLALPRHLAKPHENHVEEYGKADCQQTVTERVSC